MERIETDTYGSLDLFKYDVRSHHGPLLSGAEAWVAAGDFGQLIAQQFRANLFDIRLFNAQFASATSLVLPEPVFSFQAACCQKGRSNEKHAKQKLAHQEGKYVLLYAPYPRRVRLEGARGWEEFSVFYAKEIIEPLLSYFPGFRPEAPHQLRWADRQIRNIIHQLLNCHYEPALRDFFFDDKVRDLLFLMLVDQGRRLPETGKLSAADIEKIHHARALILSDLKEHFTITKLARKVELNEFKLKTGFRELFGTAPFTLLKQARMDLAYDLLQHTGRPIKDICSEAGYTSLTAFVAAFRKTFQTTPGQLRYRDRKNQSGYPFE
ncbi:MAG TPA: AraC family transcriptional regulator [Flavisolibacter sp.]|nr:AraC family transcriptional regulator [Flavisolibacter sp.]